MSEWVLIIYLTTDLWIATAAYPSADACYQALEELESEPGAHGACFKAPLSNQKSVGDDESSWCGTTAAAKCAIAPHLRFAPLKNPSGRAGTTILEPGSYMA
jgi:hypothetical protein